VLLPTPVPAVQTIGGTARNEPVYDVELVNSGVNILGTTIVCFQDFNAFKTVTAPPIQKQQDRDTNLGGSGASGLPQGHQMFAYAWTCEVHAMDADLATFANRFVLEQINRFRRLSAARFKINQTNQYITVRLVDLVGYEDSLYANTTHGGTTVITPNVGAKTGKALTSTQRYRGEDGKARLVRNSPYVIMPQQQFRVETTTPQTSSGATFILTVPLAPVHKFLGVLVRPLA
jgi:hypothetical protein